MNNMNNAWKNITLLFLFAINGTRIWSSKFVKNNIKSKVE